MARSARRSLQASMSRSTPSGDLRSLRRLFRGSSPRASKSSLARSIRFSSKSSAAWRTFLAIAADSCSNACSMRTESVAISLIRITPDGDRGFMSASSASARLRISSASRTFGRDDPLSSQAMLEAVLARDGLAFGGLRSSTFETVGLVGPDLSFACRHGCSPWLVGWLGRFGRLPLSSEPHLVFEQGLPKKARDVLFRPPGLDGFLVRPISLVEQVLAEWDHVFIIYDTRTPLPTSRHANVTSRRLESWAGDTHATHATRSA